MKKEYLIFAALGLGAFWFFARLRNPDGSPAGLSAPGLSAPAPAGPGVSSAAPEFGFKLPNMQPVQVGGVTLYMRSLPPPAPVVYNIGSSAPSEASCGTCTPAAHGG